MEVDCCLVCHANLTKRTAMERHIHINRCLDSAQQGPTDAASCPICRLDLGPLIVAERNQHVLECVERHETDADFEDDRDQAVLQAFASALTATIDIGASDFQCWMCAKPLRRVSVKSRLSHLTDCTRIPTETLASMFRPGGDDADGAAADAADYRIKSKGLTPDEILSKLQAISRSVDRQLLSLNLYRQNLQVQIDRARTLLPSNATRTTPATGTAPNAADDDVPFRRTRPAPDADALPAMKPSALMRHRSDLRHDAGPEAFPVDADARVLVDMASGDADGIDDDQSPVARLSQFFTQRPE